MDKPQPKHSCACALLLPECLQILASHAVHSFTKSGYAFPHTVCAVCAGKYFPGKKSWKEQKAVTAGGKCNNNVNN